MPRNRAFPTNSQTWDELLNQDGSLSVRRTLPKVTREGLQAVDYAASMSLSSMA